MASTFSQLVEDVRNHLLAYLQLEEQFVTLTGAIDSAMVTLNVDSAANCQEGEIEIGDELILIKSVDRTTNTLTARARGWSATTAASHGVGDIGRIQPIMPRNQIKRYLNASITGVFPDLWRKPTPYTFQYTGGKAMYGLPADTGEVLTVKYSNPGITFWQPARSWEIDDNADVTDFPNKKALLLGDAPVPGQRVQVVYTAVPNELTNDADVLGTVTGLPESCSELLVFATVARLLPGLEAGRLQRNTVEQSVRDQNVRSGDATNTARYYWGLYKTRLAEEREKLNRTNTIYPRSGF